MATAQHTSIQESENSSFVPNFDADGNQALVKTSTDIWEVIYNAENHSLKKAIMGAVATNSKR